MRAGDRVTLFTQGKERVFTVKAVLEDSRLTGAAGLGDRRRGGVLPLATAQELFNTPGQLTFVVISNQGGVREGLEHSDQVTRDARQVMTQLGVNSRATPGQPQLVLSPIKSAAVAGAETGAAILTTFFLVLGLFSIGAGVLLIFMIFVMLAAERKPEMGMARAVGTKRLDLVQIFLGEGMGYNLIAAAVGTGLGVLVSFGMSRIMAALFAQFDVNISPYVTPRTMIISYALGVVLTFITVTFSSWRVSQINIVRAIRDIPEPPPEKPAWKARGFFSTLYGLIFKPGNGRMIWRNGPWGRRLGVLVLGAVLMSATAGASDLVVALGSTFGGILIALFVFLSFKPGPLFVIASIPLLLIGMSSDSAFGVLFGLSLLPLGLAMIFRSFGSNERLTYTLTGLLMLYVWELDFSVGLINKIFGETEGDIEMFFLSGVMVTIAATFVVVYNADIILGPLTRIGRGLGALLPSIKMAVAYPLSNRMRTGMTMAMFCLVVFALTVISSMNYNFNRLFISDRALGGWDVIVDENPTNPIGDLTAKLRETNSPAASKIESVGMSGITGPRNGRVCQLGTAETCSASTQNMDSAGFVPYQVRGEDDGFLNTAQVPLQTRAKGYASDADVWRAVQQNGNLAVVDSAALVSGGGFGSMGFIEGLDDQASDMEPVPIRVVDQRTRKAMDIQVIGVVELGASGTFMGVHVNQATAASIFGSPDLRRFFVKTTPGADNVQVARDIEASLLTTGAQADSLRRKIDEENATFQGFFYLMQGFMGLGLFVGVAAVGVIAFRTVVERRQQIGMLRAIGYTKSMIGLTFLIESSFIAFMGVLSGVVFALILARQLITEAFQNQGVSSFAVPWTQVSVIAALAFGFALLMTLIPSRQAASIPIAEALRYE
jgi:putative ABC transport system permease protein